MKTNKSIRSRYKVTKNNTVLRRGKGGGHLNAKAPRSKKLARKRNVIVDVPKKVRQRFFTSI